MSNLINNLEKKIVELSEAYYLGEPVASDEEFDNLCSQLKNIDPTNPILLSIGFGLKVYGEKSPLPLEIKQSLPKVKDISEYRSEEDLIVASPKIDGLSVIIHYSEGKYSVLTRGDGQFGVDITAKTIHIPSLISKLKTIGLSYSSFYLRGELFVKKSVFISKFQEEYANSRNLVSGIVNRKSFKDLDSVSFLPFDVSLDGLEILVGDKASYIFSKTGVKSVFSYSSVLSSNCKNLEVDDLYKKFKEELDLPLDGIVLDGKTAWKSKNESVTATIDKIYWKRSDLGRLIPVAVLDKPVSLYGTQVTRASAFNFKFVDDHKLDKGTVIKITKANEIIPYITEVVSPAPWYVEQTICNECNNVVRKEGVHIYCDSCYNPVKSALIGFTEEFILPKGVQQSELILDSLSIQNPRDLAKLYSRNLDAHSTLTKTIGPSKTNLIYERLVSKSLQIDRNKFISSLKLPNLGEVASKEIAPFLEDYVKGGITNLNVKLSRPSIESLVKYHKIVVDFYNEFRKDISSVVLVEYIAKACVTGKLSESRESFSKKLESKGVLLTDKLDKETILVTNDVTSGSSKNKKAQELGIEIITEKEARSRWLQE